MRLQHAIMASGLFLAVVTGAASGQPINERPMFGNLPKNAQMLRADQKLIEDSAKFGSRAHTSDLSVATGWRYFFERRDIATAMKRFNQAWLLDPDNGDAFHGFAILVMERDRDIAQADALFRQGLEKPRQSPGIWLDYGRFLVRVGRPAEAIAPLRKAVGLPGMGPDAQALLTLALHDSGDLASACAEKPKVLETAQKPTLEAVRKIRCDA